MANLIKISGGSNANIQGKTVFETGYSVSDANAAAYISAVEAADGASLENPVKQAIDQFVLGCKSDGIWSAIKASCILAGARTLNGSLVPLVGTAPTSSNFVSADYNRKTGLIGNGTTKFLSSNYAFPTTLQNNCHVGGYYSVKQTTGEGLMGGFSASGTGAGTFLGTEGARLYQAGTSTFIPLDKTTLGFRGISRSNSSNFVYRCANSNATANIPSTLVTHQNQAIFARYRGGTTWDTRTNARISFYSIGQSLNLALLDTRVSALMTAINSAI
jgi:hypothetical protein